MQSCPQCRLLLEPVEAGGLTVAVCRSCGGAWFPNGLSSIPPNTLLEAVADLRRLFPGLSSPGMFQGLAMPCPSCAGGVLERDEAEPDERETLSCSRCGGVWLRADDSRPSAHVTESAAAAEITAMPAAVVVAGAPSTAAYLPGASSRPTANQLTALEALADTAAKPKPASTAANDVLDRLTEGNRRFVEGRPLSPNQGTSHRSAIAAGQHPSAIVIGCSDSRVPPEIVFDQGLGDLFVVRTAGNTLGELALSGISYAVEQIGIRVVVVLGHARCSAVGAAIKGNPEHPYIARLIEQIQPAADRARALPGDTHENAVKENVYRVLEVLANDPTLKPLADAGAVRLAGAYYHLESGRVEGLPERALAAVETAVGSVMALAADRTQGAGATEGVAVDMATALPGELAYLAAPAAERYCPQCRIGLPSTKGICPICRGGLVMPHFRVRCLGCGAENPVAAPRCWACGREGAAPYQPPPAPSDPSTDEEIAGWKAGGLQEARGATGCGTALGVVGIAFAAMLVSSAFVTLLLHNNK